MLRRLDAEPMAVLATVRGRPVKVPLELDRTFVAFQRLAIEPLSVGAIHRLLWGGSRRAPRRRHPTPHRRANRTDPDRRARAPSRPAIRRFGCPRGPTHRCRKPDRTAAEALEHTPAEVSDSPDAAPGHDVSSPTLQWRCLHLKREDHHDQLASWLDVMSGRSRSCRWTTPPTTTHSRAECHR
jgi:hypothetical protein